MKEEIKKSATTLGSIGAIGGFIADVLTPLGPFTKWLFIVFSILTILFFVFRMKDIGKKYLPLSFILSLVFGSLFLFNGESKNGFLGDNIDEISSFQTSLFDLKETVNRVEGKVDKIDEKIDLGFEKIEELIKSNNPIENPTSAKDHIVNAYLFKTSGMLKKSEYSFDEYFRLTNDFKVDVLLDYCEVYESNNGFVSLKSQLSLFPSNDVTRVVSLLKTSIDNEKLVNLLLNDTLNNPELIKWAILSTWEMESVSWITSSHWFEYGHYMFTSHLELGYYCENVHQYFFNNSKAHELILTNSWAKKPLYFTVIDWMDLYPDHKNSESLDGEPWTYANPMFPQDQYEWSTVELKNKADELEKLYQKKRDEGWFR